MRMAGSMALYSSSPPAIWSGQTGSPSSVLEGEASGRSQPVQRSSTKPVVGGLSSLFSTSHARPSCGAISDVLDSACLSSGMIRSRSHNDLCSVREGTEGWCGAVGIPASAAGKVRECSPVSVFQGPSSHGSSMNSCKLSATARDSSGSCGLPFLDGHVGHPRKRHSLSLENRRPISRHEGFEIRREQSWSSFTSGALEPCLEYQQSSELSDDGDLSEVLSSESGSVQPGTLGLCLEYQHSSELSDDGDLSEVLSSELGSVQPGSSPVEPSYLLFTPTHSSEVLDNGTKTYAGSASTESTTVAVGLLPYKSSRPCTVMSRLSLFDEILKNAQSRHEIFNDPFIVKAFREAERAHLGQFRATGDPYLVHCVETALLLAAAGASKNVVAAGLLHDTLDESSWDQIQLRESFGVDVLNLIEGVSKLSELSQLARNNNTANNTLEADRLRTMFLAMVDVRVVLIKLADRLHNMRTLGALSETKQRRIASETLEIFAPLASRLGIWSWKAEMEDLCFKHLKPQEHQELVDELSKVSRERTMMSAIEKLDLALRKAGVSFHDLCGRTKNLYGIHSKMLRKGRRVDEIYDVRGIRLIVTDENSCFTALEVIHQLWSHIPGKLKDYINHPKHNGYQSLHLVVMGDDGLPLEVQIRTMEMHHQAEFGMAAHWRYKEGNCKHSSYISQRVEWARWVLTWHSEITDSKLRLSPLEMDLRPPCPFPSHVNGCPHSSPQGGPPEHEDDPVFVIILEDEKMMVRELPSGSTAGDLLRRICHRGLLSDDGGLISWKETRPIINHRIVDNLEQKLLMGDLIELTPFITAESLDMCREKIRRMYGDSASIEGARRQACNVTSPTAVGLST